MAHELRVTRVVDAAPEIVFDAYVDPDAQGQLFGEAPDWIVESECDLRVGGYWTITFGPPGSPPTRETNIFTRIERPHVLAFDSELTFPDGASVKTDVEIAFRLEAGKTRVDVLQRGFSSSGVRDSFAVGWEDVLEALNPAVRKRSGG